MNFQNSAIALAYQNPGMYICGHRYLIAIEFFNELFYSLTNLYPYLFHLFFYLLVNTPSTTEPQIGIGI